MNLSLRAIAGASLLALASAASATPGFVNGLAIAGNTGDQFGSSVNDGRLGMFSDLYYDRQRNEWWGLSDRGPGGGTLSYDTRVQRFTLDVDATTGAISNFQVVKTVKFKLSSSTFNGLAPTLPGELGRAFDPEGFVVNPVNGHLLVSDEYGPSVYEFKRNGQFVRAFNTPDNLVPKVGASANYLASGTTLTSGREGNRGLEGLTISPDGRFAYAMMQNGTVSDSNLTTTGRGMYARIVKYDTRTGDAVAQYAYRLDGAGPAPARGRGISAIVALDDTRFMVLERNNRGIGVPDANIDGAEKLVYLIDIAGASDVTGVDLKVPLPAGVNAVQKAVSPLIDLAANTLTALGGRSPEKWEGLTVGPQLNDGSFLMLAGTDNDYSVTQDAGTSVQRDVYFKPLAGGAYARIRCDIGTLLNCLLVAANGTPGAPVPADFDFSGYRLIPGVLHAYKASPQDLAGLLRPR
jgi:hypothetical protein